MVFMITSKMFIVRYIYTYKHTNIHTYTHTYIHTYVYIYTCILALDTVSGLNAAGLSISPWFEKKIGHIPTQISP